MDRIEGHNLMVHDGFPFNGKKKKVCHRLPEKIIIPIIPLINVEVWLVLVFFCTLMLGWPKIYGVNRV